VLVTLAACFQSTAQGSDFQNDKTLESSSSSSSSSSLSLRQEDEHIPSFRRSLRKQIGDCKGSKFQIVIHFDSYPEDFSMKLVNDDKNTTVWEVDDPKHTYTDEKFQHKTVAAGICLPREWCWVLTVYDKNGDGYVRSDSMNSKAAKKHHFKPIAKSASQPWIVFLLLCGRMVGNDLTSPGNGGGFRLLLNGETVNYYTGKHNGCYKKMWFRFGEWCGAGEQFGYEQSGDDDNDEPEGCGNFTVGRAPDDGWFEGDLYQVGTANLAAQTLSPAPSPSPPVPRPPVRIRPTDKPVRTDAPVRVGPTDRPDPTGAPVEVVPTDRPDSQDPPTESPTEPMPTPSPQPTLIASAEPSAEPAPQRPPVSPAFCHFRYCN
jgi:hypothetical protein